MKVQRRDIKAMLKWGRGRPGQRLGTFQDPSLGLACRFQETQVTPFWPDMLLNLNTDRDVKATTTGKNQQVTVFSYKIFTTVFTVTSKIKTLFSNQTHQF